jgi:acetylornithine/N-succinyldiaminopimelate aminotransferase
MVFKGLLPVYQRSRHSFEYGEGVYLYTTEGHKCIDFATGMGVNIFGHSHQKLKLALKKQADRTWHTSNMYDSALQRKYANNLCKVTDMEVVFFANSGTEAVETAIKAIRSYQHHINMPHRYKIISFLGAYHGRTYGALSDNDIEAVRAAIDDETCAVIIEPIQGNYGVEVADKPFLTQLRKLCDQNNLILCADEVQSGMGRTGYFLASQYFGIKPDMVTLAKGMANGVPVGAFLSKEKFTLGLKPGDHGSTFGGNPLAMAVGIATLKLLNNDETERNIHTMAAYLHYKLNSLVQEYPEFVEEVRGIGLFKGIKIKNIEVRKFAEKLRDLGVLTIPSGNGVIRILPPYIINEAHVDEAIEKIKLGCRFFAMTEA